MGQAGGSQINQPQQLSSGVVPAVNNITHQLSAKYPNATPAELRTLASHHLSVTYRARQAAIDAATGNSSQTMLNNTAQYAQMMRQQQTIQARGGDVGAAMVNGVRPPSRSATPQTQRSGSAQGGQGQNQSPQQPQAQIASGQ
jgi:chromatin modification-related protein VID21